MEETTLRRKRIAFFGHFGQANFGNESTLQAALYHLRRRLPDAEITCICTGPQAAATTHNIAATLSSGVVVKPLWLRGHPLTRLLRKILIGIPSEFYRWLRAFSTLRGTDMLIIAGTGLLTDVYNFTAWGPYSLFKWSLTAKLSRCKLLFVSVGAGPLYTRRGKYLIKLALSSANFRSYRDNSTLKYLRQIGFSAINDSVYPDLAFSLPQAVIPRDSNNTRPRPVVGLGLMDDPGKYSTATPTKAMHPAYLNNLVIFANWLLAHGYDIRLLIGDSFDTPATHEFRSLLQQGPLMHDSHRIIHEPISSVDNLLSQLASTDLVVATRFHNLVLALVLNKPVISISFHPKCISLMNEMGLSQYSQDMNNLNADRLIHQFCQLEKNAEAVRLMIKQRTDGFRKTLDEQYNLIFKYLK